MSGKGPLSGKAKYILMDEELVPFADAKVHVLSNCVTYALTVFEGIRGYWNDSDKELYLFRLDEHLERLQQSMRAMRFDNGLAAARRCPPPASALS